MKALVKKAAEVGLWMQDVPMPTIGDNDLLIKVKKTAICGTDVHIYKWDEWSQRTIKTPMTIGHEFVGEIVEMGRAVRNYQVGERVSAEGHIVCGVCRTCRAGKPHLCPNTRGIGVNRDGCFAEYVAVPASNAWHVDDSISDELAAIFDPYGNATHTALSFDMVGEDVLITGAGPIGCMAAAIARHVGARNVVVTDMNDYRLDLAKQLGATRTVNVSQEKLRDVMPELHMVSGFDVGMEMSGSPQAFSQMLETMHNGGRIALLGILPNGAGIDWDKVIFKGLFLKGIYGREMYETWYKMQVMLMSGLNIAPVITHRFKFDDFQQGFDAMLSGQSGKVILSLD
ncbi:MAG: L-threonine 3-dehydrogenase [Spirochaetes bacterium GWD1_61_31]|nr:MAG: L-threonine 3-dehydrogenase [Spirochaetes bacterium GWB1_60_80]OHD35267.1 MAG: L-threonine 3-dehydrogenase [Spirochaetes bacterium GWC1_61_12]OHD36022.1 MAG: L-threonine 3-dehydrogenase [Spirochaetes bacterium GWD1_61_31]OHD42219.1 MAG: L-threonine 3-dehydrogenase [Spirochaetes bacterium GWE1_60_18]OHD57975.1 MAG: L-threonine 3-dehydrogenase [Spirochaetes bacterium GWF1_60_12]HAP44392.1 L-threonine 3-dehydrogenase [Spirochaetaceae bacterium]